MMQTLHRWTRIVSPIRSIQALLILLACIAAFLGSFIHRQSRSDLLEKYRSLELWHEVYAKPNINRLDEKSKIVPKLNFRYPFAVDFGSRDNEDSLFPYSHFVTLFAPFGGLERSFRKKKPIASANSIAVDPFSSH